MSADAADVALPTEEVVEQQQQQEQQQQLRAGEVPKERGSGGVRGSSSSGSGSGSPLWNLIFGSNRSGTAASSAGGSGGRGGGSGSGSGGGSGGYGESVQCFPIAFPSFAFSGSKMATSWDPHESILPSSHKMMAGYMMHLGVDWFPYGRKGSQGGGGGVEGIDNEMAVVQGMVGAATLRLLHRQHLLNIPFDNVSLAANETRSLDIPRIYLRLVGFKKGGIPYETNLLFSWVLQNLKLQVDLLEAWSLHPSTFHQPRQSDHICLLVHLNGVAWLADVSQCYGADAIMRSFLEPLIFELEIEQVQDSGRYRIVRWPEAAPTRNDKTTNGQTREGQPDALYAVQVYCDEVAERHSTARSGWVAYENTQDASASSSRLSSATASSAAGGTSTTDSLFSSEKLSEKDEEGSISGGTRGSPSGQVASGEGLGVLEGGGVARTVPVSVLERDGWSTLYRFSLWPRDAEYFQNICSQHEASLKSHLFFQRVVSKMRSEAGGGGQVLLSEREFAIIRERKPDHVEVLHGKDDFEAKLVQIFGEHMAQGSEQQSNSQVPPMQREGPSLAEWGDDAV